ncbi:MAG: family 16 glycoside hydrolase [Pirellulales bacterium]
MLRIAVFAAAAFCLAPSGSLRAAETVNVAIDPTQVLNRVDEKVYGHFLEHIYHSVNGGLWGEMIWNRSFEDAGTVGAWRVEDGCLAQRANDENVRLVFGDPAWRDYEFTLEAQKTGGSEGFLILVRVAGDDEFYWCNLGGWGNQRHGLERGLKDGNRWGTIGRVNRGSIDKGKWYQIRVRCQGRRIQAWLDGAAVLDVTDDARAHLAGKVGVGTWATQARFRKLKVASLDGKVLFEGLPEPAQQGTARSWKAYGPGKVSLASDNPPNGETCQEIASDGPETGLRQTALGIRKGEKYQGSLWVRGGAPGGLVVRVVDGQTKLAELSLAAPKTAWSAVPFQFQAAADAKDAAIEVGLAGKGKVWIDQVSLMADASRQTGGFRPDLLQAIGELKPPVIRWPGGCYASFYRWKDGVGPQHKRLSYPRTMWDDKDVNSFGTDEFVAMCRKVGAEPLIVINIGSNEPAAKRAEYIAEACQWIEYCNGPATSKWGSLRAANGHPDPYRVKYWEIDNETWHMGVANYVAAVRDFAPALKKADPSIRLLACGSGGLGDRGNGLAWNRTMVEGCAKDIDYLSVHHYENPDAFAQGPRQMETFLRKTAELIADSANPKLKIYCSEWNAQSTDWRTGLYAGGVLNAFERCGDFFEIGGPALFLRHVSARDWDNAFVNFDQNSWFPAPNYVVMKLWRDHYAPERIAADGDAGALNAVATRTADGTRLYYKAVNPANQAVRVRLTVAKGFRVGKAGLELVAPGGLQARNTLADPRAVVAVPGSISTSGQTIDFTLPPLSAGVVTVEKR